MSFPFSVPRDLCTQEHHADLFFKVINHPQTEVVVASRMAPKQKAYVVELIKVTIQEKLSLCVQLLLVPKCLTNDATTMFCDRVACK